MHALLLNGAKQFSASQGRLNTTLHNVAAQFLAENGWKVREVRVDSGFDIDNQIALWQWADLVVYQIPTWWLSPPWHVKKYIDEVLQKGQDKLWKIDPSLPWGQGGLLDSHFMVSMTWSAPTDAFSSESGFLSGYSVDDILLPIIKTHEFLGMTQAPTFSAHDVMYRPDVEKFIADYKDHLKKHILPLGKTSM